MLHPTIIRKVSGPAFLFLILASCTREDIEPPQPVLPVPSEAQMKWHEMEMNAFIHFTTNTFTNLEWGFGNESPAVFNPTDFDADQWATVLNDAGFKGVILTCKHHDGFCLWPSNYSEHTVKNSPWKEGQGDVVREVAAACRRHGLKFGVYLSPWDRNHADYGKPEYIEYYRNQLTELFTNYGDIFEMWFDGANGGDGYYGGSNEVRRIDGSTYYDWPATLDLVRSVQPEVIFFSDAGPGVRWCGNEQGVGGETNWCTITPDTLYAGKGNIGELLNKGSEAGTHWIPAEVNTSIRPGWFYHEEEDSLVKSPEKLFQIYLTSVGRGSTLLLNMPPDRRGRIHEQDIAALRGWRLLLDNAFSTNFAANAPVKASANRGNSHVYDGDKLTDGNKETYWTTNDDQKTGQLEIDLGESKTVRYILLQEYIRLGQRVKTFTVDAWKDNDWVHVANGTTIGYKRILQLEPIETPRIRISIDDARACPVISNVEIY
jgi:alpha-L-fucosidase